ncbi:VOC family protein [Thermoproteota archaeon]
MDHTIVHFEIPAKDLEKQNKFYSKLFGWKIEKVEGMDYCMIYTVPVDKEGMLKRPGVNGGMIKKQNPDHKTTNYISVESIDTYSKKIEKLGGNIIVPKTEIPGIGWWAMALDPDGNQFAIMESLR